MMKTTGQFLREARKNAKKTVKEVSSYLIEKGYKASDKTIYSWENNNSEPTPGALLELCRFYNIKDIFSEFGLNGYNEDGSIQLNLPEQKLIEKYRKLDDERKQFLIYILDRELEQMKRLEALIEEEKDQDVELLAAHERTDIEATEEMVQHDLDLMNDPDF